MTSAALEMMGVSKEFFGTAVVRNVSLKLAPGAATGLVGENGAGKSTLIRIIGGQLRAEAGGMQLDGTAYAPHSAAEALARGVRVVHQELNLFGNLSVAENLALSQCSGSHRWLINRRQLHQATLEALSEVGLHVDPDELASRLSPGEQQLVEIAKAIRGQPRVVLFDEPTTSLTGPQIDCLFEIIGRLKRRGVAVLYVSHNLSDVRRICESTVVLRDGAVQAAGPTEEFTSDRMISLMVGRDLPSLFPMRQAGPSSRPVLAARNLTQPGVVRDVTFALHEGEILGISGLMGSGRSELTRILFGLDPVASGRIEWNGQAFKPSPARCVDRGMALVTESRRSDGLLLDSSAAANATLASLPRFASGRFRLFRGRLAKTAAETMLSTCGVNCQSTTHQRVRTLSGGNQQKVVLAKWLMTNPAVIILDEPTRGIDVGARSEIYRQIVALADRGVAVLIISSELEELVGLCDRILVMNSGEIVAERPRGEFDREAILRSAFGEERLG
ncbi:MAG TPA: sugar ABC transporter ATP-binding protein [Lacipirellulaceae bacterium]|nr:sugar ABC transporter ATP-binding protein [Lacipirellulaceae bacterium]HMP06081.1 sugar ABC transporter ATP-binding protein [Lacipirellulaceae bacterium]